MSNLKIDIQLKNLYNPESTWTSIDPILSRGEIAYSSDKNGSYKIGDGEKHWTELEYCKSPSSNTTASIGSGSDLLPTASAVKTYVDNAVKGASNYLGTVSSLNNLSTTARKGDYVRVSSAFNTAKVGDLLIAEKDSPSQIIDGSNWSVLHNDTDTNKYTDLLDTWTGTKAQYEAQKGNIAEGTYVNITDDYSATNFAAVATTGQYSDLIGRPTKVSDLTNDAGYVTLSSIPTNTVPTGTIIQVDKNVSLDSSWQYLGTGHIEYENGAAILLSVKIYKKL